jgi:uncharacterized protein DUF929
VTAIAGRLRLPDRVRRLPRWRTLLALVVTGLVVIGILAGVRRGPAGQAAPQNSAAGSPDNRTLLDVLQHIDPQVAGVIGGGGLGKSLVQVKNAPALLGASHHPQVVFLASEGCALCAAQRWSMVIALSRFGSVKDVMLAISSVKESTGPLATFSFRRLQYTSSYIDLVAVETIDADGHPLATLSPADQKVVDTYDVPPYVPESARGALPWLDVANRYVMAGSGYPPQVLQNLNWAQIDEKLGNAKDPVTEAVVGNANWITAAICRVTGMSPEAVCQTQAIGQLAQQLG